MAENVLFAQLVDLPGWFLCLLFFGGIVMPQVGLIWLVRMIWRRRFGLLEMFLFVAYLAVWLTLVGLVLSGQIGP